MINNLIRNIIQRTIVEMERPTAMSAPESGDFIKVNTWTTDIIYEEDYDENVDKMTYHYVCYNGNNREFENAITPIISNSGSPEQTWLLCATILLDILRREAVFSIWHADFISASEYIESLDVQYHALKRVKGDVECVREEEINKIISLLPSLKIITDLLYYEECDY